VQLANTLFILSSLHKTISQLNVHPKSDAARQNQINRDFALRRSAQLGAA
jgi:hypothetical protein